MSDLSYNQPCRVVKVGGSLFGNERLVDLLRGWLDAHNDLSNIIICGGGKLVDALREWSRDQRLDDETAHWSAIRLMDESTRLLASRIPEIPCDNPTTLPTTIAKGNCFWLTSALSKAHSRLLRHWDVTSDSLAAELAQLTGASELCLLKGTLPDTAIIEDWVASGYVDRVFPESARSCAKVAVVELITGRSLIAARL